MQRRNEIIALSIRYGLMSRETSFVAIERRDTPVIGDVKLRKVPIALTTGWGGLDDYIRRLPPTTAWRHRNARDSRDGAPLVRRYSRAIARSAGAVQGSAGIRF